MRRNTKRAISSGNTVSVISDSSNIVVVTDTVGTAPVGLAFDSHNDEIYVACNFGSVSVLSETQNLLLGSISVPTKNGQANPTFIAFDSHDHEIYESNVLSGTVGVISDTSNTFIKTIAGFANPEGSCI